MKKLNKYIRIYVRIYTPLCNSLRWAELPRGPQLQCPCYYTSVVSTQEALEAVYNHGETLRHWVLRCFGTLYRCCTRCCLNVGAPKETSKINLQKLLSKIWSLKKNKKKPGPQIQSLNPVPESGPQIQSLNPVPESSPGIQSWNPVLKSSPGIQSTKSTSKN